MTYDEAHRLFEYRDGHLHRRIRRGPARIGDIVGSTCTDGALQTSYKGRTYYVHRIIYLMHTGHMPEMVDHINTIRTDNRIDNLRAATRSQNNANAKIRKDNSSGIKGVAMHKGKWRARITVNKKQIHLGYFDTAEEAERCVDMARKTHHGQFARKT